MQSRSERMFAFAGPQSDLSLTAIVVVIWVVAISVAFGFYIPVMRARAKAVAVEPPTAPLEDLDHAPATSVVAFPEPAVVVATPEEAAPAAEPAAAAVFATSDAPEAPEAFSVLIVDDNDTNRLVLEMILDSVGVAHTSVVNGLEAVEAMAATPYQAVLMDLQMPVMDGFEATRRIRELENQRGGAQSSIIVVSANCQAEDIAAGRASGADEHLAKPVSAVALLGALESCASANRMAA